jgi:hypothetical protein
MNLLLCYSEDFCYSYGLKKWHGWRPVAHTCNPSYSRSRDQEDWGSKPTPGKQYVIPYLKKNLSQKSAGGVAQGKGPEFKPQYCKKKKKIV